jgi:hypothetical protein
MTGWLDRLFLLKKGEYGKVLLSVGVIFLTTANLIHGPGPGHAN